MNRKQTILITGGAGFIGSHLADALLARGNRVTVLDDLSTGSLDNLPHDDPNLEFIEGSILDDRVLKKAMRGCNAVVHLAAISSVRASIDDPQRAHAINLGGTLLVAKQIAEGSVRRVVYSSSAAVYGNTALQPVEETVCSQPLSPYAIDKLASEHYLAFLSRAHAVNSTIFRLFNVFGSRQHPRSEHSGVVSIFLRNAALGRPLSIYGDGEQSRDFVFVEDVAILFAEALHNEKLFGQTMNVGTGNPTSINELARIVQDVSGKKLAVKHEAARDGEIRHSVADVKRLASLFGRIPATTVRDGMARISNFVHT